MVDFFLGIYHNYVKPFGALVYTMYTLVHLLLGVVSFNEYIAYLPIQIEKKIKKTYFSRSISPVVHKF